MNSKGTSLTLLGHFMVLILYKQRYELFLLTSALRYLSMYDARSVVHFFFFLDSQMAGSGALDCKLRKDLASKKP